MTSLSELPELMEKRDLGSIAKDMNLTLPMDGMQSETDMNDADSSNEIEKDVAEVIELRPTQSTISDQLDPQQNMVESDATPTHDDDETDSEE